MQMLSSGKIKRAADDVDDRADEEDDYNGWNWTNL